MQYTISEFSKLVSCSPQAIYKRIPKDLAPYVTTKNGIKYISDAALALYTDAATAEEEAPEPTPEENQPAADLQTVQILLTQIKEKDQLLKEQKETIASQADQIKELYDRILQLTDRITNILSEQTTIQTNFQLLLAQQTKQIEHFAIDSTIKPVESTVETVESAVDNQFKPKEEKPHKKGLFSRLFG